MKVLLVALAGIAAGLAGGFAIGMAFGPNPPPAEVPAAKTVENDDAARLEKAEKRIAELERNLAAAKRAAAVAKKTGQEIATDAKAETVAERKAQIEVVSLVRNFSWLSLSDSFPDDVVQECKSSFDERVAGRFDYIQDVCKTFDNWTL